MARSKKRSRTHTFIHKKTGHLPCLALLSYRRVCPLLACASPVSMPRRPGAGPVLANMTAPSRTASTQWRINHDANDAMAWGPPLKTAARGAPFHGRLSSFFRSMINTEIVLWAPPKILAWGHPRA